VVICSWVEHEPFEAGGAKVSKLLGRIGGAFRRLNWSWWVRWGGKGAIEGKDGQLGAQAEDSRVRSSINGTFLGGL
jgi:hypothetical protein